MKIVIVGAGTAGKNLVARLTEMGQDVVAVDKDTEVLGELASNYDILTLMGNGADPSVREEATAGRTALLATVTPSDEVNLLSCCWAKAAEVDHTAARLPSRRCAPCRRQRGQARHECRYRLCQRHTQASANIQPIQSLL